MMDMESTDNASRRAGETQTEVAAELGALVVPPGDLGLSAAIAADRKSSGPTSTLLHAVLRLEAVIDEEILVLQSRRRVDYDAFSRRKNRGLLELVRSSKNAKTRDLQIAAVVERLRTKLVKNQALLRLHFDAIRLVADIICKSFRDAESDGTYAATSRARK